MADQGGIYQLGSKDFCLLSSDLFECLGHIVEDLRSKFAEGGGESGDGPTGIDIDGNTPGAETLRQLVDGRASGGCNLEPGDDTEVGEDGEDGLGLQELEVLLLICAPGHALGILEFLSNGPFWGEEREEGDCERVETSFVTTIMGCSRNQGAGGDPLIHGFPSPALDASDLVLGSPNCNLHDQ